MSRSDDILQLLDNALETPAALHSGFGNRVPDGRCWRCESAAAEDERSLCAGCRAFLLEDSDDDPAAAPEHDMPVFGYAYFLQDEDGAPAWAAMMLEADRVAGDAWALAVLRPAMTAYLRDLGRRRREQQEQ